MYYDMASIQKCFLPHTRSQQELKTCWLQAKVHLVTWFDAEIEKRTHLCYVTGKVCLHMGKFFQAPVAKHYCLPVLSSLGPRISDETLDLGSCSFNTFFLKNIKSFDFCFINKRLIKAAKNSIYTLDWNIWFTK